MIIIVVVVVVIKGPDRLSGTVAGQTNFDVIVGQYVVCDRNLAFSILFRHKALFHYEFKALTGSPSRGGDVTVYV